MKKRGGTRNITFAHIPLLSLEDFVSLILPASPQISADKIT